MAHYALFELASVVVDKFARKNYKALAFFVPENLKALVKKARHFSREGICGSVFEFARAVIRDAGLGRVGDNKSQIGIFRIL